MESKNSVTNCTYTLGYQLPASGHGADVLYVNDHFDPKQLAACRDSAWVVSDFYWHLPEFAQPWTAYPFWVVKFCEEIAVLDMPAEYETSSCFNFMMNKMRPLRRLALEVFEYHQLNTATYTANSDAPVRPARLPYTGSDQRILDFISWRRPELSTPKKMFSLPVDTNFTNFVDYLHSNVFGPSAVALITEPVEMSWVDSMNYSEKTVFAMLSHNFPIWVGGQAQADTWRQAGFDVFDDVVDHSYQHQPHWFERMFYAVHDNLRLLTDFHYVADLRKQHHQRLQHNRSLIQGSAVKNWADQQLSRCPEHIQLAVKNCIKTFAG